jgi:hypothetical protein
MRYVAMSLLLAWFTGTAVVVIAASPVASPDATRAIPASTINSAPLADSQKEYGVLEETPNQRRRREGKPIVASYPPPEYGELLETPNHMRKRLGLPLPTEANVGSAEETPNHRRQRLTSKPLAAAAQ